MSGLGQRREAEKSRQDDEAKKQASTKRFFGRPPNGRQDAQEEGAYDGMGGELEPGDGRATE